ncbi:MAG: PAS domain-containing protein [Sulfitobacter sp.]
MSDYQPHSSYSALAQVEAYWEALRGGRTVPLRSEIDPRGIELALAHAFIVERIAPSIARLRVAGNHLSLLMGMDVRGMPLTALFTPEQRRKLADTLEEVFEMPATSTISLVAPAGQGQSRLEGRMILLPLQSDMGDISRLLGCLVVQGEIGIAPRRLEIAQLATKSLRPQYAPEPEPDRTPAAGFSEPASPFKPTQVPHLRVIRTKE